MTKFQSILQCFSGGLLLFILGPLVWCHSQRRFPHLDRCFPSETSKLCIAAVRRSGPHTGWVVSASASRTSVAACLKQQESRHENIQTLTREEIENWYVTDPEIFSHLCSRLFMLCKERNNRKQIDEVGSVWEVFRMRSVFETKLHLPFFHPDSGKSPCAALMALSSYCADEIIIASCADPCDRSQRLFIPVNSWTVCACGCSPWAACTGPVHWVCPRCHL